jgi:hypothetical protein
MIDLGDAEEIGEEEWELGNRFVLWYEGFSDRLFGVFWVCNE